MVNGSGIGAGAFPRPDAHLQTPVHQILAADAGSLALVADVARAYGDAPQLVYDDETWTFAEHHAAVLALAAALRDRYYVGLGSRVAIAMRNYPEFSLAFWATQVLGAIAVPVNAWWQQGETAHILDLVRPSVVLADAERVPRVGTWARRTETPLIITRGLPPRGQDSLDDLLSRYAGHTPPAVAIAPDEPSTILFTSGTTGAPKGVVHTHGNHMANLRRTLELADPSAPPAAQLATMPLFHITQLSSLYVNAALGAKTVFMRKWDAARAVELIDEHAVTQTAGVPMQVQQLLDLVDEGRTLPSLTTIGIGATAVPPHLPTRVWETFGGRVSPMTGYGMTETTSSVTSLSGEEFVRRPSSVGRPHPFNEVRILGDDQREVPVGEVGEIWVRGPNVTTLEWTRAGTAAVRHSTDFIATGDLGRFDDEGFLSIVGRSKDIIIRAGENVHSVEVEAALLALPGIAGAAVVGLPHDRLGEEVTAIIRPRPRAKLDLEAIRSRLASQLAYFKVPTRYHVIDTEFPTTATGKILKRELRDRYVDVDPDLHDA